MAEITLNSIRSELIAAFPNTPALQRLPILRPIDEATLYGWYADNWAASQPKRQRDLSLLGKLKNSTSRLFSVISREVATPVEAMISAILAAVNQAPVTVGGDGSVGSQGVPDIADTSVERSGEPTTALLSNELDKCISVLKKAEGADCVLQSVLSSDELGRYLARLHVRKNTPVEMLSALQPVSERVDRSQVKKEGLKWNEKAILALSFIQTMVSVISLVAVVSSSDASENTPSPGAVMEPIPPRVVVIVNEQKPQLTVPQLVEVEVFNSISAESRGVIIRADNDPSSERLGALDEGARAHLVHTGGSTEPYSLVRYSNESGEFCFGWVLTEKLRRVN